MIRLLPLVLFFSLQDDPKEKCAVRFSDMDVFGSRFEKQVTAKGNLTNLISKKIEDVRVKMVACDSGGNDLVVFPTFTAKEILPRRAIPLLIKDQQVDRFASYRLEVSYTLGGKKHSFTFICKNPESKPELKGAAYAVEKVEGLALGFTGIKSAEGTFVRRGQKFIYTGNTLFLRIRIQSKEDPPNLAGEWRITATYGKKKIGTIKRYLKGRWWRGDAARIPEDNADPKIIAWDSQKKELVLGMFRIGEGQEIGKLTLDIEFKGRKIGKWKWKKLTAPFIELPKNRE